MARIGRSYKFTCVLEGIIMHGAVSTILSQLTTEYPGITTRELEIREVNHYERDLLIRGLTERDGAFLLATCVNDFEEDASATVAELADLALESIRSWEGDVASIAMSLRFERSKAANSWAPNTLFGLMLVAG